VSEAPVIDRPREPAAAPARREGGPSFGLALGGGGARGLAHIHVIEVLDELGIRPVAIAGSSIGAIIGAGMASGMTGGEIRRYVSTMLGNRSEVLARMWRSRPGTFSEIVAGGLRVTQFDVERILKSFLPSTVPDSFEELAIPLMVTATDYYGHCLHVFEEGDLYSALGASAAIPAVFRPVRRDGRLLIDGGIYNPVPFDLLEGKADIVIAVDVVGAPTRGSRKRPSSMELMFGASQLMMQSITAMKLKTKRPEILLRPPVSRFRVLDFLKVDAVMAETASIREETRRAVEAAVEAHARRSRG
jgi:NTE family protein